MLATKKTYVAPSFEDRLNAAHATADAAVSIVETIAIDLEAAAAEKHSIIGDIDVEVDRLYVEIDTLCALREEAAVTEAENLAKANNIRSLLSA